MAMTLAELLTNEQDGVLLDIENELLAGVVPATGATHAYCRKVNKMIDAGECQINPTTYRKVYLPTLARAVQAELARRYTQYLLNLDKLPSRPLTQHELEQRFKR